MCGIVAILAHSGKVRPDVLDRAIASLRHRGPDGEGAWIAEDGRVGLGHARLSIIDVAGGAQPIASEDERVRVVVNGEFYEHESWQRKLEQRGHRLRTRSDSELLAHLYEDEGVGCLRYLRGEFAFALWDSADRVLFAARDRFGIKPLYYTFAGDRLLLASEAKALFAAGVVARWDAESLFQELHGVLDNDRTLFDGVYQVPPGHYLLARGRHHKLVKYWDVPHEGNGRVAEEDRRDAVDRVAHALRDAVRVRLRADVPVACYLSGGLDSSAIAGISTDVQGASIDTFTIAFTDPPYDESEHAEEVEAFVGSRGSTLRVTEADIAAHWEDAVGQCEMINWNGDFCGKYLLSRHVRDAGFKVVLTGEGADEVFGGYAMFFRDQVRAVGGGDAATSAAALHGGDDRFGWLGKPPEGPTLPLESTRSILGYVPEMFAQFAARGAIVRPLLAGEMTAEYGARDPYRVLLASCDAHRGCGRTALQQSMYLWTKTVLPNRILNYLGDRTEMAHSVEARTPFLDHHLVELVAGLPDDLKIRGTNQKFILREAAKDYVPQSIYERQKQPFLAPTQPDGPLLDLATQVLHDDAFAQVPYFDHRAVRELLADQKSSLDNAHRQRQLHVIFLAVSTAMLASRYGL